MAKKSSAKSTKKPARSAKPATRATRKAPTAKAASGQPKYAQAGAPWWKQFLPG